MKKIYFVFIMFSAFVLFFHFGCKTEHKVAIETPKPIKIEARIDIYVHAETIEDMVKGKVPIPEAQPEAKKPQSSLHILRWVSSFLGASEAYAQEIPFKTITDDIRKALQRRKERYAQIESLVSQNKASEGPSGYLVPGSGLSNDEQSLISQENNDRKFIYSELAGQNGISLGEVEKAFAKVHNN
jgi:uncharacterized protein YdbL (DUF1318 family)